MLDAFLGTLASLALANPSQAKPLPTQLAPSAIIENVDRPATPFKRRADALGVKTSSPSVFVADVSSGKVLYAKDPHRMMSIASLTKLVTAMVLLDQKIDLKKTVVMQEGDFDGESKAYFKAGDEISYEDLLRSLLVGSVNASANAIARSTLGTERFVEAMNAKVRELKLATPEFVEPSGIDPDNRASAADVAALLTISSRYPEIRNAMGLSSVDVKTRNTGQTYRVITTNLLLSTYLNKKPFKIVAAKTGSLPEAGYCMAQVTRDAEGHEIVAVELGSENHYSRYQDIKALTAWTFDAYEWR